MTTSTDPRTELIALAAQAHRDYPQWLARWCVCKDGAHAVKEHVALAPLGRPRIKGAGDVGDDERVLDGPQTLAADLTKPGLTPREQPKSFEEPLADRSLDVEMRQERLGRDPGSARSLDAPDGHPTRTLADGPAQKVGQLVQDARAVLQSEGHPGSEVDEGASVSALELDPEGERTLTVEQTRRVLQAQHGEDVSPHFVAGHWDDWLVATVGRDLWRFGVTLLKRGSLVLVDPTPCTEHENCRIAYSVLRLLDVHTPTKYLTIQAAR